MYQVSGDQKQSIWVVKFKYDFHFLNVGNEQVMELTQDETKSSNGMF